jgi:hypothetical protein
LRCGPFLLLNPYLTACSWPFVVYVYSYSA